MMPSWAKRFTKQIKRLKSSLQRRGSVRVYKMADRVNRKCVFYFVIFRNMSINSLHLFYVCFVDCCIAASLQTVKSVCSKTVKR